MREDRSNDPFGQQFVQMHIKPSLFLRAQSHGPRLDGDFVAETKLVVVFGVLYGPDIGLLCCQAGLERDQTTEEILSGLRAYRLAERTFGQGQITAHDLGGAEGSLSELLGQQILLG